MQTIGEAMKIARVSRGYTAEKLSEATGVCKTTIYHAEQGRTYPSILTLLTLADELRISLDEYVGRGQLKG